MSAAPDTRRPGRPRSAEAHAAILRATLGLAAAGGLRGLRMEAVAARAGVGKATIYRRWKTKEALFTDALRSVAADVPEPEDTGSARGDFLALHQAAFGTLSASGLRMLPLLMIEAAEDPELLKVCQDVIVRPRREMLRRILQRGIERGELRQDLDLELAIDILIGPMIYRALISGIDVSAVRAMREPVWDAVMDGLAAPSR